MISSAFERYREILAFLVIGGFATLTHYCVAVASVYFFTMPVQLANICGFALGFVVSYFGHAKVTFQSSVSAASLVKFIALAACNYVLSSALLYLFTQVAHIDYRISFLLVVSILPIVSFLVSKYLIFDA